MYDFGGEPAFRHRSFMLDVSRDRVPRLDTILWLMGLLAELRYTQLQLYIEHTYEYRDHEVVWREASPLSAADVATLRRAGRDLGIELVANVNTFGHMERWLRHDRYRQLAECPEGIPGPLGHLLGGPTCLEPTAANAGFGVGLAREMVEAVGSRSVMIGGDEPFELGLGRSAERVDRIGRDELYRRHLGRIIEPLVDDGVDVLFWGDQFRRDAEAIEWIPAGATCVVWNYEAPQAEAGQLDLFDPALRAALGLPDDAHEGFAAHARLLLDSGKPAWLACGSSSWNTLIGRNDNAARNIDDAAVVGANGGIGGFMLTDWGDNGHWQPLGVSLPSIVRAAVASWSGEAVDDTVDVGAIVDELLGAPAGTGESIDELGRVGERLGLEILNATPIFDAAVHARLLGRTGEIDPRAVDDALEVVEATRDEFAGLAGEGSRLGIVATELAAACGVASLGLRRLAGSTPSPADVERVEREQRHAWLLSSRLGGLDDSIARLRR